MSQSGAFLTAYTHWRIVRRRNHTSDGSTQANLLKFYGTLPHDVSWTLIFAAEFEVNLRSEFGACDAAKDVRSKNVRGIEARRAHLILRIMHETRT